MKAVCTGISGNSATFHISGEKPVPGSAYILEEYFEGTQAQNRAFHALLQEYWRTGLHSYDAKTFGDFRNMVKRQIGAGFEAFVYIETDNRGLPQIKDAKYWEDVPENIRKSPDMRNIVRGRLKSWSDYTKRERKETLDRLISEMQQVGVNTKKFDEILSGMSSTVDNIKSVFGGETVEN